MREDLIERLQLKRDVWRGTEFGDDICELLDEAADALEAMRAEVERVTCELMDATTRADKLAEALRELRDLMLGQVKWMPCDCGCPQQRTPDGPHSATWLRAAQQVEIAISKAEAEDRG